MAFPVIFLVPKTTKGFILKLITPKEVDHFN